MFTGIFVLRIRVCTNIEAGAAEENFVPHIPLVPSVLFTAGTEPCFKTTVYSRIFEFQGKKHCKFINLKYFSFCLQTASKLLKRLFDD